MLRKRRESIVVQFVHWCRIFFIDCSSRFCWTNCATATGLVVSESILFADLKISMVVLFFKKSLPYDSVLWKNFNIMFWPNNHKIYSKKVQLEYVSHKLSYLYSHHQHQPDSASYTPRLIIIRIDLKKLGVENQHTQHGQEIRNS